MDVMGGLIIDGCIWTGCDEEAVRVFFGGTGHYCGVCEKHPDPPTFSLPIAPFGVVARCIRWPGEVEGLPEGWRLDIDDMGEGGRWLKYRAARQELNALVVNPVPPAVVFVAASRHDGLAMILGWVPGEALAECGTVERGGRLRWVVPGSLLREYRP